MESSLPFPEIHTTDNYDKNSLNDSEYEDIISTLPQKTTFNFTDVYQCQGYWYYKPILQRILWVQQHVEAKPSDVIIASAPETATTWIKALTFAISTRKRFNDLTSPLLVKLSHTCYPLLELNLVGETCRSTTDPDIPLISTHIPYTSLPKSFLQQDCKIFNVWRDAKDTVVSFWHFNDKILKSNGFGTVSMEEAFECFCQGVVDYGPYWDHVLSYWNARVKDPNKVLFLKYEDMMKDTAFYVKTLAEFLGCPFTPAEEENGVLEKMVNMCSFGKQSYLEVNKSGHLPFDDVKIDNRLFFSKAEVGDWRNHITSEMGARLDSIMEAKLKGSGLSNVSF